MLSKKMLCVILAGILLFTSGCWGSRELNDITIITGMALDIKDGQIYITTVGTDPTRQSGGQMGGMGGGGGNRYSVFSAGGSSIFEAARNMTQVLPRRNIWSHCELIVVSDKVAREEGIRNVIDFFTRDHARRRTARLIITRGEARKLLEVSPVLSDNPATEILNIIEQAETAGKGMDIPLYQLVSESEGISGTGLAPHFSVIDYGGEEQVSGRGKEKLEVGAAVFKEYRLVGYLTPSETRGVNWLQGRIERGVITFPSGAGGARDTTVEINNTKIIIQPVFSGDGASAIVEISITGAVVEYLGAENILDEKTISQLEENCSGEVRKEILKTWEKAQQEIKTDMFRLGSKFTTRYPYLLQWSPEEWNELFQMMQLELEIKTEIKSTGIRRKTV